MPNDPSTHATLVTSLANWLNRTDLSTTEIPEAIALAERHFQRVLNIPEQEAETTLTATAETVALPSDFVRMTDCYLNTDPRNYLEPMPLPTLRTTYSAQTTGKPQNYAIRGESLVLGPAPDTSYDLKLAYFAKYTALTSGTATNILLTDHPDVYIYGSLAEIYAGICLDEQRALYWAGKRDQAIDEINLSTIKRRSGTPTRIRSPYVV